MVSNGMRCSLDVRPLYTDPIRKPVSIMRWSLLACSARDIRQALRRNEIADGIVEMQMPKIVRRLWRRRTFQNDRHDHRRAMLGLFLRGQSTLHFSRYPRRTARRFRPKQQEQITTVDFRIKTPGPFLAGFSGKQVLKDTDFREAQRLRAFEYLHGVLVRIG